MFRRIVLRSGPAAKLISAAPQKTMACRVPAASRSLSTMLDKKEHGEEAIYIRKMEADREKALREKIDHILALEEGHEDKKSLEELLAKPPKKAGMMAMLSDWKFALPIGMFIAIPALSNEVLVLDAETQLVACFIFFCSMVYTQAGGMIAKSLDDYSKNIENQLKKVDDVMLTQLNSAVEANSQALSLDENMMEYHKIMNEVAMAQADLLNHQAQHQYRDAVVKKLDSLVALEESAAAAIRSRMLADVKADVIATFKNDKKVQEAALNNALAVLSTGATGKMGKDIVGEVFMKAVQDYKAKYEKMPPDSDPILMQLKKDLQALAVPPVVEGSGGNVFEMKM